MINPEESGVRNQVSFWVSGDFQSVPESTNVCSRAFPAASPRDEKRAIRLIFLPPSNVIRVAHKMAGLMADLVGGGDFFKKTKKQEKKTKKENTDNDEGRKEIGVSRWRRWRIIW